jgi:hypothetical protein
MSQADNDSGLVDECLTSSSSSLPAGRHHGRRHLHPLAQSIRASLENILEIRLSRRRGETVRPQTDLVASRVVETLRARCCSTASSSGPAHHVISQPPTRFTISIGAHILEPLPVTIPDLDQPDESGLLLAHEDVEHQALLLVADGRPHLAVHGLPRLYFVWLDVERHEDTQLFCGRR